MISPKWPMASIYAIAIATPGVAAPARDARGIPVISNPASPPAGFNGEARQVAPGDTTKPGTIRPPGPVGPMPPAVPTPHGGPGHPFMTVAPPPCTRTVTDGCLQTYERSSSARTGMQAPH